MQINSQNIIKEVKADKSKQDFWHGAANIRKLEASSMTSLSCEFNWLLCIVSELKIKSSLRKMELHSYQLK